MNLSKFWKSAIAYRLAGGHAADHQAMGVVSSALSPPGQEIPASASILYGTVSSGVWYRVPSIFRLRISGAGSVSVDSANNAGVIKHVADYVGTAIDQIQFPYLGDDAKLLRVTYPVGVTVEVL